MILEPREGELHQFALIRSMSVWPVCYPIAAINKRG